MKNRQFTTVQVSSLTQEHQFIMLKHVYAKLRELELEYNNFGNWYREKVAGGIGVFRDVLITLYDSEIAGIAILKSGAESKICTLRVIDGFQGMGIGKSLMETSFDFLETDKPLITVSSKKSIQFKRLFERYNFKQEGLYPRKYNNLYNELSFNGILVENTEPAQGNLFREENLLFLSKISDEKRRDLDLDSSVQTEDQVSKRKNIITFEQQLLNL